MRHTLSLVSPFIGWAVISLTGPTALAQEEPTAQPQQRETLQQRIRSARKELTTERQRSQDLQRRLECTEELLDGYRLCGQQHDTDSEAYWDCVQSALAEERGCEVAQSTVSR